MARYHGQATPSPRHMEALNYVMRAMAVNGIALPLQVLRSLEAAALCRWLGLHRKFAFLLRLAAVQASELGSYTAALALARVAAAAYGVRFLDEGGATTTGGGGGGSSAATGSTPAPSPSRRDARAVYPPPPGGWPCLQRHLLGDLVAFATAARDIPAACGHYLALLHLCAELEGSRQRALLLAGDGGGGAGGGVAALPTLLPPSTPTITGAVAPLSPSSGAGPGAGGWPELGQQPQASSPLTAWGGRQPKLLALDSASEGAEQPQQRRWSDGGGGGNAQHEDAGGGEGAEEDGEDDYDDFSDDGGASDGRPASGGRPLSAERWQLRGGVRMGGRLGSGGLGSGANLLAPSGASSSLGGFSALRLGFNKGTRASGVLRPFRSSSSRGAGDAGGDGSVAPTEDRASSAGSSSVGAAAAGAGGAMVAVEGGGGSCWTSLVAPNVAASPEEQEALIAEMMRLTRRLPPRTPLASHGLPHVHFVRPLRLAPDLVPIPHKPAVAGGAALSPRRQQQAEQEAQEAQAFIYNPFADRGAGGAGRIVTWAAGEVALVALAMSNPLAAPVNVQSIELLVEPEPQAAPDGEAGSSGSTDTGPVAFCYPLTLWVPPYSRAHPLTLALKPLRPGALVIKGVKMTVFNITSTVRIDPEGSGPAPALRAAPRDWYPRQARTYSRTPAKGGGGRGEGNKKGGEGKGLGSDDAAHRHRHPSSSAAGAGGFQSLEEAVVPTTRVGVVAPLPRLTTRLDRWATNVELLPGEYRRARLELEVANEVPIGYLEVCVHQKALTRKHKAAGRPVPLYVFAAAAGGRDGRARCLSAPEGDPHHPLHPQQQEHLAVALDPLGLDALTAALRSALRAGSCLPALALPLLLRRVDRYPEADVLVRYSAGPAHQHQRTLTIPLRFHLKDGLAATDLAVETARVGVYPALGRMVEASHRLAWRGRRRRCALLWVVAGGCRRRGGVVVLEEGGRGRWWTRTTTSACCWPRWPTRRGRTCTSRRASWRRRGWRRWWLLRRRRRRRGRGSTPRRRTTRWRRSLRCYRTWRRPQPWWCAPRPAAASSSRSPGSTPPRPSSSPRPRRRRRPAGARRPKPQ